MNESVLQTCDTSLLVSALAGWHPRHEESRELIRGVRAVPAHVLIETYSVLTRLPPPHRVAPADAGEVISSLSFRVLPLPEQGHRELVTTLGRSGIQGGAAYDGLVGATAKAHGCTLLTRDGRARRTYDVVGVSYRFV